VALAEDQHAVEELSAQGTDKALAGCIGHHRQLHPVWMICTDVCG
jgi:hypothetical protein